MLLVPVALAFQAPRTTPHFVHRAVDPIREWVDSQGFEPGTRILVNDVQEGVSFSAIFWSATEELLEGGRAVFVCPEANPKQFPIGKFAKFVESLDLPLTVKELIAPFPAMSVEVEKNDLLKIEASGMVPVMQQWVQDVIVDSKVCPFTSSATSSGAGVRGVQSGPIAYPTCGASGSSDAALISLMASFWGESIELLNAESAQMSTLLLCAPFFAVNDHDAFVRMTKAVVGNLKLVGADQLLSLVFFHPLYQRALIDPVDKLVHGHLPPNSWLPAYLRLQHDEDTIAQVDHAKFANADYQRRAPFTVINVLRANEVAAAESVVPWEIIEPQPDRRVRVSGARVYAANTWRLATQATFKNDPSTGHDYLVVPRPAESTS